MNAETPLTGLAVGIGIGVGYAVAEAALDGRLFENVGAPLVASVDPGTTACAACGLLQPELADNCIECGTRL